MDSQPSLRSNSDFIKYSKEAVDSSKVVKGVKGPSVLSTIFYFNLAWAFVPDYMHCVLLGVVRQCLSLWFDSSNHTKPWSLSTKGDMVDRKLCSIKPSSEVNRLPRSIKTRKYWKASEFRSWLLFYSIPVLHEILPSKYLNHWFILVFCIFTLLKSSVSSSEIDLCKALMDVFCMEMGILYGKEQLTFNVHQLTHLPLSVQRWGPLWATSAFRFEDNNGVLLGLIHGTQQVNMQLVNTLKLINGYNVLRSKFSNQLVKCVSSGPLGKLVDIKLTEIEKLKLDLFFGCPLNELQFYSRCKINHVLFCSKSYKQTNRCNYAVKYYMKNDSKVHFGFIKYFVQSKNNHDLSLACVVERHDATNVLFKHRHCNVTIYHLIPISQEISGIDVVPLVQIEKKMLCITNTTLTYFPNDYEFNL